MALAVNQRKHNLSRASMKASLRDENGQAAPNPPCQLVGVRCRQEQACFPGPSPKFTLNRGNCSRIALAAMHGDLGRSRHESPT